MVRTVDKSNESRLLLYLPFRSQIDFERSRTIEKSSCVFAETPMITLKRS
jgi:hypothetical protein